jgi:predicted acyltransferase
MIVSNQRLLSLDLLRGLTIIFMIIVNDPGSWDHVYPILRHASWNSITPTDYIFPLFLFIMGCSVVLSIDKQRAQFSRQTLLKKILFRALKIYAVGILLWLWPAFELDRIRWVGVLPRIALVYLACALLYLYTTQRTQHITTVGILIGYWIVICYVPIPGLGAPDISIPEKNWAHYIDSLLLPGVLWQKTWDPEGILSTLPAIATGLLGVFTGKILQQKDSTLQDKLIPLFLMGTVLLFLGDIGQYFFPLNKNLWSSSFTLLTAGIGCLGLGACIYLCDIKGWGKHLKMAHAFGVNSIFSYVLASLFYLLFYSDRLWSVGLNELFMTHLDVGLVSKKFLSLSYALLYAGVIWIPTQYLFKKKIYIKL